MGRGNIRARARGCAHGCVRELASHQGVGSRRLPAAGPSPRPFVRDQTAVVPHTRAVRKTGRSQSTPAALLAPGPQPGWLLLHPAGGPCVAHLCAQRAGQMLRPIHEDVQHPMEQHHCGCSPPACAARVQQRRKQRLDASRPAQCGQEAARPPAARHTRLCLQSTPLQRCVWRAALAASECKNMSGFPWQPEGARQMPRPGGMLV